MGRKIGVAVIGCGTVGTGVVNTLLKKKKQLQARSGHGIELIYVCDREKKTDKELKGVPSKLWVHNYKNVIEDDRVDIVVELVGGTGVAKDIVVSALKSGKAVVTANKALLSMCAKEVFDIPNGKIFFEASVAGAVPVIKAIRESLVANKITSIYGILNGTCNYILTKMFEEKKDFASVLKEAQALGYAEKDAALDVDGWDSAHKLSILGMLAMGIYVRPDEMKREGIAHLGMQDIEYAADLGYRIRLLCIAKEAGRGRFDIRVNPALVRKHHLLAKVEGVLNAVYLKTDIAGDIMLYGAGAGRYPTASAVVSDIVDAAKAITAPQVFEGAPLLFNDASVSQIRSRYYLRLSVIDRPGVLEKIAGVCARNNISIASVQQKERATARTKNVPLVLLTHEAEEGDMLKAVSQVKGLNVCSGQPVLLRIEDL